MNCLQRIHSVDNTYSVVHQCCVYGLRIALVTIAACGLSLSIRAIVSYFPPVVGYVSGASTLLSLCGLAISYCRYSSLKSKESPLTSSGSRQSVEIERSDPTTLGKNALSNIDTVPQEIKLMILNYLSPQELAIMGLTSKSWLKTSADNTLWKEHCQRFFIPDPEEEMIEGSYKREFRRSQNLANAIRKCTPKSTFLSFESDIFSILIEKDRVFLGMCKAVQVWDRHFTQLKHTIEHPINYPKKLKMIDGTLFCISKDLKKYEFARLDMDTYKSIDKKYAAIHLQEWENSPDQFIMKIKGVLEFAKDKAFVSYENGDIRLWNIRNDFTHYEDGSERVMQFLCGIEMYTDQLEYDDYEEFLKKIEQEYARTRPRYYEDHKNTALSLMKKKSNHSNSAKFYMGI